MGHLYVKSLIVIFLTATPTPFMYFTVLFLVCMLQLRSLVSDSFVCACCVPERPHFGEGSEINCELQHTASV